MFLTSAPVINVPVHYVRRKEKTDCPCARKVHFLGVTHTFLLPSTISCKSFNMPNDVLDMQPRGVMDGAGHSRGSANFFWISISQVIGLHMGLPMILRKTRGSSSKAWTVLLELTCMEGCAVSHVMIDLRNREGLTEGAVNGKDELCYLSFDYCLCRAIDL